MLTQSIRERSCGVGEVDEASEGSRDDASTRSGTAPETFRTGPSSLEKCGSSDGLMENPKQRYHPYVVHRQEQRQEETQKTQARKENHREEESEKQHRHQ